MENIYICEDYCTLHLAGDSLVAKKNGYKLASFPMHGVKDITITENVQITSQALKKILESGIDVVFIKRSGKTIGRIFSKRGGNVLLRLAQYEMWKDPSKKVDFAKSLIRTKVANQIFVLKKYQYYHKNIQLASQIHTLEQTRMLLDNCQHINEVTGYEGIMAKEYFKAFGDILLYQPFFGRTRQER